MKYTPKELKGNVNISHTSPIKEFLVLLGGLLAIVLAIYILLGFAVNLIAPRLSPEIEQGIGIIFSNVYEQKEKSPADARLQELFDGLVNETSWKGMQFTVSLVPDPRVNAMALPGGRVVVFQGLIKEVESENELAFVLAHELGHFANRDHLRGLGRMLVFVAISATILGPDSSVTAFLMNSLQNVEMKFSQNQEQSADLYALDLLYKRYGQVAGARDFMERIGGKEKRGRFLYYFSTHPHPKERVNALEERIRSRGYRVEEKIPLPDVFRSEKTE